MSTARPRLPSTSLSPAAIVDGPDQRQSLFEEHHRALSVSLVPEDDPQVGDAVASLARSPACLASASSRSASLRGQPRLAGSGSGFGRFGSTPETTNRFLPILRNCLLCGRRDLSWCSSKRRSRRPRARPGSGRSAALRTVPHPRRWAASTTDLLTIPPGPATACPAPRHLLPGPDRRGRRRAQAPFARHLRAGHVADPLPVLEALLPLTRYPEDDPVLVLFSAPEATVVKSDSAPVGHVHSIHSAEPTSSGIPRVPSVIRVARFETLTTIVGPLPVQTIIRRQGGRHGPGRVREFAFFVDRAHLAGKD